MDITNIIYLMIFICKDIAMKVNTCAFHCKMTLYSKGIKEFKTFKGQEENTWNILHKCHVET